MSLNKQKRILDVNSNNIKCVLANRLNRLCEFLDDSYNINSGGCCFITYCLARLLKKDKFKFKIIIYEKDRIPVKTFADVASAHTHYGILLGDYHINGIGYCDTDLVKNTFSRVKISKLLEHYKNHDWNHCYDSQKNSFILKTLKAFYNDLIDDLRKESSID